MNNKELILSSALGERDLFFSKIENNVPERGNVAGISFVAENITKMEAASRDKTLPLKSLTFASIPSLLSIKGDNFAYSKIIVQDGEEEYPMSEWGLGQVCSTLKVPATYMKRCIVDSAGDVAVGNLNYWARREHDKNPGKDYFIRLTDNRMHGFLSNRYCAFDDSTFLKMVIASMPQDGSFRIMNQIVSPEITKIRLISNEKMTIDGDDYSVGLDISNSRVGRSSIKLEFLIFRWICTNGMMVGGGKSTILQKIHRNIEKLSIEQQIVVMIQSMPELLMEIKGWVESSKQNKIDQKHLDLLTDGFRARANNSDKAVQNIKATMASKYDQSMWGYIQSITEVAQTNTIFTREAMERYAGMMLLRG